MKRSRHLPTLTVGRRHWRVGFSSIRYQGRSDRDPAISHRFRRSDCFHLRSFRDRAPPTTAGRDGAAGADQRLPAALRDPPPNDGRPRPEFSLSRWPAAGEIDLPEIARAGAEPTRAPGGEGFTGRHGIRADCASAPVFGRNFTARAGFREVGEASASSRSPARTNTHVSRHCGYPSARRETGRRAGDIARSASRGSGTPCPTASERGSAARSADCPVPSG